MVFTIRHNHHNKKINVWNISFCVYWIYIIYNNRSFDNLLRCNHCISRYIIFKAFVLRDFSINGIKTFRGQSWCSPLPVYHQTAWWLDNHQERFLLHSCPPSSNTLHNAYRTLPNTAMVRPQQRILPWFCSHFSCTSNKIGYIVWLDVNTLSSPADKSMFT